MRTLLADMLGEELSSIAPHVFELWSARSIDAHGAEPGAALADRPLRATRVYFDDAEWEELQQEERQRTRHRTLAKRPGRGLRLTRRRS